MAKLITVIILTVLCVSTVKAQDTISNSKFFNFGIGVSGWGIPVYGGVEFPVGKKNQTIMLGASYQTNSESYGWLGNNITWRHTIIGIDGSFNYYFDDFLNLPPEFDSYAGIGLGYYFWRTKITESINGFNEPYTGTGSGGLGVSFLAGGRYYLKEKLALSVQFGGGTIMSSGRIGLSLKF